MKPWYDPRTEFSPYEFGVAQSLLLSIAATAIFGLIFFGAISNAVFPVWAGTMVVIIIATNILHWLARCPNCGKAATMRLLSRRKLDGLRLFQVQRAWPERVCGECGQDLTAIARRR